MRARYGSEVGSVSASRSDRARRGCGSALVRRALALASFALLSQCDGSTLEVLTVDDAATVPPQHTTGQLIHYGVDTPEGIDDLRWFVTNRALVDDGVYDGLVLDLGAGTLTSTQPLALDEASSLLATSSFPHLVSNFQVLRLGEVDLTDDVAWAAVLARAHAVAAAVRSAKVRGFFFDTQQESTFRTKKGLAFDAAETIAKQRGYGLMTAVLAEVAAPVLLTSLAFVSVFVDGCFGGAPLAEQQYGLLGAFLDGMLAARSDARSAAEIVDAFLPSYPTRNVDAYRLYYDLIHFDWQAASDHWVPGVVTYRFVWNEASQAAGERAWPATPTSTCSAETSAKLQRNLPAGFGIALDYDRGTGVPLRGDASDYRPPAALQANVARALATADRWVWTWSGHTYWPLPRLQDRPTLPASHRDALRAAKQR
jgi:hypothetical protein